MTTLINMHSEELPPDAVRIDRQTIFGNPFRIGRDGSREEVIAKYVDYFYARIENDKVFRKAVLGLRNKVLACWCAPQPCHGEVIIDWLDK